MRDIPIIFSASMVLALLREAREPGTGKSQDESGGTMTIKEIYGRLHRARNSIALLRRRHGKDPAAWDAKTREEYEKLKRVCRALQAQARCAA